MPSLARFLAANLAACIDVTDGTVNDKISLFGQLLKNSISDLIDIVKKKVGEDAFSQYNIVGSILRRHVKEFNDVCEFLLKELFKCENPKKVRPPVTCDDHMRAILTRFYETRAPDQKDVQSILNLILTALPDVTQGQSQDAGSERSVEEVATSSGAAAAAGSRLAVVTKPTSQAVVVAGTLGTEVNVGGGDNCDNSAQAANNSEHGEPAAASQPEQIVEHVPEVEKSAKANEKTQAMMEIVVEEKSRSVGLNLLKRGKVWQMYGDEFLGTDKLDICERVANYKSDKAFIAGMIVEVQHNNNAPHHLHIIHVGKFKNNKAGFAGWREDTDTFETSYLSDVKNVVIASPELPLLSPNRLSELQQRFVQEFRRKDKVQQLQQPVLRRSRRAVPEEDESDVEECIDSDKQRLKAENKKLRTELEKLKLKQQKKKKKMQRNDDGDEDEDEQLSDDGSRSAEVESSNRDSHRRRKRSGRSVSSTDNRSRHRHKREHSPWPDAVQHIPFEVERRGEQRNSNGEMLDFFRSMAAAAVLLGKK